MCCSFGPPETNSALSAWMNPIGLEYEGAVFRISGKDHGSENDALVYAGTNPQNRSRMVVVAAGNSPLGTILLARAGFGPYQCQIFNAGKPAESGFLSSK